MNEKVPPPLQVPLVVDAPLTFKVANGSQVPDKIKLALLLNNGDVTLVMTGDEGATVSLIHEKLELVESFKDKSV